MRRAFKRPPRRRAAVLASGRRRLRASLAGRELGFITTSTQTSLLRAPNHRPSPRGEGGGGGGGNLARPSSQALPRPPAALLANSLKPPRSAANPKISNYNPGPQRLANSRPPRRIPRFQITIPAPSAFMQTRQIPQFQITIPPPRALQTRQIPRFQITIPAPSAFMQTRDLLGKSPDFNLQIPVLRPPGQHA